MPWKRSGNHLKIFHNEDFFCNQISANGSNGFYLFMYQLVWFKKLETIFYTKGEVTKIEDSKMLKGTAR